MKSCASLRIPFAIAILAALPRSISAAPGDLDPTFNGTGKVIIPAGSDSAGAECVTLQPDGKILLAGYATVAGLDNFAVIRLNADGSADSAFGNNGSVITDLGGTDRAVAAVVQTDGKIVLAGRAEAATPEFALVRYRANGSLDVTFGTNGVVLTDFAGGSDFAAGMALQGDGKFIVAGYTVPPGGDASIAVARYLPNGSLDTSLNGTGKVVTGVAGESYFAADVIVSDGGKIIVGGHVFAGNQSRFALVRYNADGSLDTSFRPGPGGRSPLLLSDGNIVLWNAGAVSRVFGGTVWITVTGPSGAELEDGGTVDFGNAGPNNPPALTFTIRNTGAEAIHGLEFWKDGTHPGEFTVNDPAVTTLAAGASATLTVTFDPSAAGPRSAVLHLTAADADEDPFDITLSGVQGTASEAWRFRHFGTIENSGTAADLSDPDNDTMVNRLEFATDNNPLVATAHTGGMTKNGSFIEFIYRRAKRALAELSFAAEYSDSLTGPWNQAGAGAESILSDDGTVQTVAVSMPAGPNGRRFVRLRVVKL